MTGHVLRTHRITRPQVRVSPDTVYVFGDNMARAGMGGQAGAMRGEPNAVGVPTKWRPARDEGAYFTDACMAGPARDAIDAAFLAIEAALAEGRTVVIPADGLGTGLAELPQRAPAVHAYIEGRIGALAP